MLFKPWLFPSCNFLMHIHFKSPVWKTFYINNLWLVCINKKTLTVLEPETPLLKYYSTLKYGHHRKISLNLNLHRYPRVFCDPPCVCDDILYNPVGFDPTKSSCQSLGYCSPVACFCPNAEGTAALTNSHVLTHRTFLSRHHAFLNTKNVYKVSWCV